ncbi:MAG: hypothetical protein WC220_13645, partial [Pedobacter sp.]
MKSTLMFNRFIRKLFSSLIVLFCVLFIIGISEPLRAQNALPITESFSNATAPNMEFGGNPGAFLTASAAPFDAPGSGFLRLTTNGASQTGYARSTGSFASTN